jgi:hypothetical protein
VRSKRVLGANQFEWLPRTFSSAELRTSATKAGIEKGLREGAGIMNVSVANSVRQVKEVFVRQISIADPKEITPGTVFIRRHTLLPHSFEVESKRFSRDWQVLQGVSASAVEKHLRDHGWSFSFVAPTITAGAFGRRSKSLLRPAVDRALSEVGELGFNAMEIESLEVRRLAGLGRVKVVGHPRQVSDSVFLHPFDLKKRNPRVWEPQTFDPYRDLRRKLSLEKYPGLSGR